jgi:hypothetical protein
MSLEMSPTPPFLESTLPFLVLATLLEVLQMPLEVPSTLPFLESLVSPQTSPTLLEMPSTLLSLEFLELPTLPFLESAVPVRFTFGMTNIQATGALDAVGVSASGSTVAVPVAHTASLPPTTILPANQRLHLDITTSAIRGDKDTYFLRIGRPAHSADAELHDGGIHTAVPYSPIWKSGEVAAAKVNGHYECNIPVGGLGLNSALTFEVFNHHSGIFTSKDTFIGGFKVFINDLLKAGTVESSRAVDPITGKETETTTTWNDDFSVIDDRALHGYMDAKGAKHPAVAGYVHSGIVKINSAKLL